MKTMNFTPVFLLVLCAGCTSIHPGPRPELVLPDTWAARLSTQQLQAGDWWQQFAAPQLQQLLASARMANADLALAALHVREAEIQLRAAGASRFPALDAGLSTAARSSDGGRSNSSSLSLSTSYEIDLWGRVAATVNRAQAGVRASQHDAAAARISIEATVANSYFQALASDARLDLGRSNLAIAERILATVETRRRLGAASSSEVALQQSAVLSQRAALLPLQNQLRLTLNALAILTGAVPGTLALQPQPLQQMLLPALDAGLPATLLTRRPDLAAAEARLAQADANVAAARAALLPSIQLTGSGGLASTALLSLSNPAGTLAVAAALSHTVFDGGRRRADVDLAASGRQQLLENYRKAILVALGEVEDALGTLASTREETQARQQIVEQAALTLRLAEARYREGADDVLTVLSAQRSLFQARDSALQLHLAQLQAGVDLYRALGGGWQPADSTPRPSSGTQPD